MDMQRNTTDKRQLVSVSVTQQLAHDNENQQPCDYALAVEEAPDPVAMNAARRRALLNKEIRAGWQRALGH